MQFCLHLRESASCSVVHEGQGRSCIDAFILNVSCGIVVTWGELMSTSAPTAPSWSARHVTRLSGYILLWGGTCQWAICAVGEPFFCHADQVWSVSFSRDGAKLATASGDKTVGPWDMSTGQAVGEPFLLVPIKWPAWLVNTSHSLTVLSPSALASLVPLRLNDTS